MMEALGRFVGGLVMLTLTAISWVLWMTFALAVVAAVIAIAMAMPPIWIVIILLILIWLK
jgi:hypothetical protein